MSFQPIAAEIYLPTSSANQVQELSREKEVVAALSRLPVEPNALDRVGRLVDIRIDWPAVIEHAKRWEVEPAVFGNLRAHFADALPRETLLEITELERHARAFAVSRTLEVMDLSRALTGAGIPAVVLKGPALAIEAYGDFSRRTFGDIDLLVSRDDLRRAQHLIIERGYAPKFGERAETRLIRGQHALEFSGPGPAVELHWSLLSRYLRIDLRPEELWRDARPLKCADATICALAPHHLFIYLSAHGAKHEWMKFRWICDVAQLARRLTRPEADDVMKLADRTNTRRIVALALRLTRELFGEEESPFPAEAFSADGSIDSLVAVAMSRIDAHRDQNARLIPVRVARLHPYVETLAFWIGSRERKRDKLLCAAQFLSERRPFTSRK